VPRFYLDVLDGDQVIEDPDGMDFADLDTAIAEAVAGARDLVAHGIMQNEDVSGQSFLIRDGQGETVATVPFRVLTPVLFLLYGRKPLERLLEAHRSRAGAAEESRPAEAF
jgi:hypothetical protein